MQGTARLPVPDQDELIVPNVDIDPAFLDYWRGGVTPQTDNLYGEHNDHNWEFKDGKYEDMGMQVMADTISDVSLRSEFYLPFELLPWP